MGAKVEGAAVTVAGGEDGAWVGIIPVVADVEEGARVIFGHGSGAPMRV